MSVPELFERWSDGSRVQIKMSSPLPRHFDLRLIARAFGPNSQLPFTMRIGNEVQTFRLSSSITEVTLPFTTDGSAQIITIEIPQPTSPKELGKGNDGRLLGIALMQMSVEDCGKFISELKRLPCRFRPLDRQTATEQNHTRR